MKDFTLYGIIIGFIVIIGIGIGENYYFRHISRDMINDVVLIEKEVTLGNIDNSIEGIERVIEKWRKDEKILEIMLNHQKVNKVSESLVEIESKLKNFLNSDNLSANFAVLKEYIKNIELDNNFTVNNIL